MASGPTCHQDLLSPAVPKGGQGIGGGSAMGVTLPLPPGSHPDHTANLLLARHQG